MNYVSNIVKQKCMSHTNPCEKKHISSMQSTQELTTQINFRTAEQIQNYVHKLHDIIIIKTCSLSCRLVLFNNSIKKLDKFHIFSYLNCNKKTIFSTKFPHTTNQHKRIRMASTSNNTHQFICSTKKNCITIKG